MVKDMRKKRVIKVSREKAIELAMRLNGIGAEIAETYTDSELKECLVACSGLTYRLVADF